MSANLGVPQDGAATTLLLGTSTWETTALITSLTWDEVTREALETTYLSTTGGRTFIPEDLPNYGALSVEVLFHDFIACPPFTTPGITPTETITVTYPILTGQSTAAIISTNGFGIGYTPPNAEVGSLMKAAAKFKITGAITFTAST